MMYALPVPEISLKINWKQSKIQYFISVLILSKGYTHENDDSGEGDLLLPGKY